MEASTRSSPRAGPEQHLATGFASYIGEYGLIALLARHAGRATASRTSPTTAASPAWATTSSTALSIGSIYALDRARLHDGLRRAQADQLRPQRSVHGRLVRHVGLLRGALTLGLRPPANPGGRLGLGPLSLSRGSPCSRAAPRRDHRTARLPASCAVPKLAPLITAIGFPSSSRTSASCSAAPRRVFPTSSTPRSRATTSAAVSDHQGDVITSRSRSRRSCCSPPSSARAGWARPCARGQDPEAARLMGITVNRVIASTFLVGGCLAGAAGLVGAVPGQDLVPPGRPRGPHGLRRRRPGRHRQHPGRRPRRPPHRHHPADLRQPDRRPVDAGDRVRLPRPGHGLPAAGPGWARRHGRPDEHRGRQRARERASRPTDGRW